MLKTLSDRIKKSVSPIATQVQNIISNKETQNQLSRFDLRAVSVAWEDTGRSKNSCLGPNISDMTLCLNDDNGTRMPVIRTSNFSDKTQDVPIEKFRLRVGDEIVSLKDYLQNVGRYENNSKLGNMYDDRDSVVLTSSQCCVLPCDKRAVEFGVSLYSYQTRINEPAVLVILVSKDGTSTQVLNGGAEILYFNNKGTKQWFNVRRLEDVRTEKGIKKARVDSFKEMTGDELLDNTLMLIQVPLKQRTMTRSYAFSGSMLGYKAWGECFDGCSDGYSADGITLEESLNRCVPKSAVSSTKKRGADMAQIGLGSTAGKHEGTRSLTLERDTRFPIRLTFQHYRVTDENFLNEACVRDIAEQLRQFEVVSVAGGSLVVDGKTDRKTEHSVSAPLPLTGWTMADLKFV